VAAPADDGEREREDDYREAAEFHLLKRAPDGRTLPVERYLDAKRHAERMPVYSIADRRFVAPRPKQAARQIALGPWQHLGPGNVGGRTRSLVIHPKDPNIMYAGAVGGGVWKSTDGGESWFPLSDLLPSIGIGALAIDPQNPDTLYAGTGEWYTGSTRGDSIRGLGIFKTTDGGATWRQLPETVNASFYYTNDIVVSPTNPQNVYAATYGGVWVSRDGGDTWRRTLSRTSPNTGCQDIAIRTDQSTDYIIAACGGTSNAPTAIFRNQDAGGAGTWEAVFSPPAAGRISLAIAPSNQSIVYAMASSLETGNDYRFGLLGVYRSISNGDSGSWETRVTNKDPNRLNTLLLTNPREALADVCTNGRATYSNQGDYDNALAVDPVNPDVVWAGGISVFRSDDGGANWGIAAFWQAAAPQLVHSDIHAFAFHPGYDGGSNQTLFVASDGGLFRTDNATAPPATGDRAGCLPYPTQVQWRSINNNYSTAQFYHGSVYPGGGAYFGGTQDNGTQRGADGLGPNDWRRIIGGDGGFTAIDPTDPNLVYGESQNFSFSRSTNGGLTFTSATRGITETAANFMFITPFEMDPSDPKRLYIGGRTLWRTEDGAANWTAASKGITAGNISAIAIAPSDPNRMVFAASNGFIYRNSEALTATADTEWRGTQPRTGYVSRLAFDPSNPDIVYATYSQFKSDASQHHVYKSTDGGATWNGSDGSGDTALPDIPVFSIIVDPQNTSTLYLGTDIGVFASIDGGATWSRDDNPFANAVTETLTLDRTAGRTTLFAFTHGRGVWKVNFPDTGAGCNYEVSKSAIELPAFGATSEVDVRTADGCTWSALSTSTAAAITTRAGGKGNGAFTITATLNPTAQQRLNTISVQDKAIRIVQAASQAAAGNDDRATPFALGDLPAVAVQDTSAATEDAGDPTHSCTRSADSKSVWFRVVAPEAGTMRLSFITRRLDTNTDAGTVVAAYNAAGQELVCSVTPQSATVATTRFPQFTVRQGESYLIQVSATTFGAPAGAQPVGGNLVLSATMVR
jgi:photosystem II stability/assembly factor-like uncharacterized protein